ncbi:MAG: tetratricopeptide repeat protein [Thermoanaerobaculum sp.]
MASTGESFRAGQAPLIFHREARGERRVLEFFQGGVRRTFAVQEGHVVGFASTHPQETPPGSGPTDAVALMASSLARLIPVSGEYRLASQDPPGLLPVSCPVTAVVIEAMRRASEVTPVLELLGSERPFVRAGTTLPSHLTLAPLETFVWEKLSSPGTLEQLFAVLPEQTQALARAFAGLACAGLLVPADQPQAATSRFPPASPKLRERLAKIAREGGLPVSDLQREPTEAEVEQAHRDKEEALALLARGEDERRAVRLLSKAVALLPDPRSLVALAEAEVANPMWRERALTHLKQALEMDPKFTPAWLALANYWALRGDTAKQRRCLENILRYDPGNRDVKEALAHLRP